MDALVESLRSLAEPTRLRIAAALRHCELTVTDLCKVLGQSQPRVSRHLRLLCDAQVLDRQQQGSRAFYRPASVGVGREVFDAIEALLDNDDPTVHRDLQRVDEIRAARKAAAQTYFDNIAADWERVRSLHASDDKIEAAVLRAAGPSSIRDLLDIGTGTGRMLEVFADRIDHGLGIDLNSQMLDAARSRLDDRGLAHCRVRQADILNLDIEPGSFDVAVLHHVLHFLDNPEAALIESAATLRPGGKLIIADFAPHDLEILRTDYSHFRLGFSEEEMADWLAAAGLLDIKAQHLKPQRKNKAADTGTLTVTVWVATQHADAPSTYQLEAAS